MQIWIELAEIYLHYFCKIFHKPRELHTKITKPLLGLPSANGRVGISRKLERMTDETVVAYFKVVPCNFPGSWVVILESPRQDIRSAKHSTCIWRRPQNMLERSEGLVDRTRHHIQEIKESAHMSLVLEHLISQPSLDISPIITSDVRKLQLRPV
jgi:hypothetical protein